MHDGREPREKDEDEAAEERGADPQGEQELRSRFRDPEHPSRPDEAIAGDEEEERRRRERARKPGGEAPGGQG